MGKYYSRIGGNLYIYVTRGDSLIDLKYFPNELNLFTAESAWRIKDKMAIVNDADEVNVDKAEIILSLNSYKRWDHSAEILEQYYASDDEGLLQEKPEAVVTTPPPTVEVEKPPEMEVIIPEARPPVLPRAEEAVPTPTEEMGVTAPGLPPGRRVITIDVSDDEFIDRIIDRMISRGLVFQYRPTPPVTPPQPSTEAAPTVRTAFDELFEIIVAALKKGEEDKQREGLVSSLDELMGALTAYIRSQTPTPEAERSPTTELMDALTDYLKGRTPSEAEEVPEKEDPMRELIGLLRRQGDRDRGEPKEPSRVDYKFAEEHPLSDERLQGLMAEEVADMYVHLAYSVLEKGVSSRRADWLSHVRDHWMELEPVLSLISEDPHHALVERRTQELKPELSKTIFEELLLRRSEIDDSYTEVRELLKDIPVNVFEVGVERNYNTFENVILKAHLQRLASTLDDLSEVSADIAGLLNRAIKFSEGQSTDVWVSELTRNKEVIAKIGGLKGKVRGYLENSTFLDEVDVTRDLPIETDVLRSHPSYSRFYAMKKSYDVNTPPPLFNIRASLPELEGSRDLYERWCGVEIVRSFMRLGFTIDGALTHLLDEDRGFVNPDDMMITLSKGNTKVIMTTARGVTGIDRILDLEVDDLTGMTARYAFRVLSDGATPQLKSIIQESQRIGDQYKMVVVVHRFQAEPSLTENVFAVPLVPGGSKRGFRDLLGALLSQG